jgi:hypothetical protein
LELCIPVRTSKPRCRFCEPPKSFRRSTFLGIMYKI